MIFQNHAVAVPAFLGLSRRRTDCPVASLLAMTGERRKRVRIARTFSTSSLAGAEHGGLWDDEVWQSASPAQSVHCGNVLTNIATPPPSACHCEPVRTPVAIRFLAEIPDMSVVLRANSPCFSYSPKVLLFVLCCRRENGLPVALLLAMTGERRKRVRIARTFPTSSLTGAAAWRTFSDVVWQSASL